MGYNTKIDWCDSTWNPVTGCLHGCEYCYARRIAERFEPYEIYDPEMALQRHAIANKQLIGLGAPYVLDFPWQQRNKNGTIQNAPYPFGFVPTFHRYKLDEPQKWKKPRNIFVCSMADLFGDWVPDEWIDEVFKACDAAPYHRYLFLTKNSRRYAYLNDLLPPHRRLSYVSEMWFGHSYTGFGDYIPMLRIPTKHRFVSIEPLLHELSERDIRNAVEFNHWIIIGAETGHRKGKISPEKNWVDGIVYRAKKNYVPVFMKESLREIMGDDFKQEFPWEV